MDFNRTRNGISIELVSDEYGHTSNVLRRAQEYSFHTTATSIMVGVGDWAVLGRGRGEGARPSAGCLRADRLRAGPQVDFALMADRKHEV